MGIQGVMHCAITCCISSRYGPLHVSHHIPDEGRLATACLSAQFERVCNVFFDNFVLSDTHILHL